MFKFLQLQKCVCVNYVISDGSIMIPNTIDIEASTILNTLMHVHRKTVPVSINGPSWRTIAIIFYETMNCW